MGIVEKLVVLGLMTGDLGNAMLTLGGRALWPRTNQASARP